MELATNNNQGTSSYSTSVPLTGLKWGLPVPVQGNIPFGYAQTVLDISRAVHIIRKISAMLLSLPQ